MADETCERAADECARVACRGDIGIIQQVPGVHGVERRLGLGRVGLGDAPELVLGPVAVVEVRRIADTQTGPPLFIWSADSRFIAFPDGEQLNKLGKLDLIGGSPQTICEINTTSAGGSWSADGTVVLAASAACGGYLRLAATLLP